jgi:hypothetical protein
MSHRANSEHKIPGPTPWMRQLNVKKIGRKLDVNLTLEAIVRI